jgi:alkylhydroperoxidase family enzyme
VSSDANGSRLRALLAPADAGAPRIAPARPRDLGPLARAVALISARVTGGGPPNVFTTLGRHPRLFRAWLRYSAHLMPFGTLPRPDTELVILRVAWNCGSAYEWQQHVPLALRVGLTADEVAGAAGEPHAFSARRQALLAAADELLADRALTDATWRALRDALSEREAIELCLLVGHYQGLATALGGLRLQVEERAGPARAPRARALR